MRKFGALICGEYTCVPLSKIKHRTQDDSIFLKCPKCGWRTTQQAIERVKLDFLCPRCGQKRLSDFTPA